jgi:hypothetical protein
VAPVERRDPLVPPTEHEQFTSPSGTPSTGLLERQIDKALDSRGLTGGSGRGGDGNAGERLARLEGVFEGFNRIVEGIRHSQNLMVGLVSLLAMILIGLSVYELQRLDAMDAQLSQTNQRVTELPGKVSSDLRDLTQTLAATITAARQPAPASPPIPPPKRN